MLFRDLGLTIGTHDPGPGNSITDVEGVLVGHSTLIAGEGALRRGAGPVRTGVTIVRPHPHPLGTTEVFAGVHVLNGNGEVTGLSWLEDAGVLTTPIAITNTSSVGLVRDTLVAMEARADDERRAAWCLPVVAETWDGVLNDTNGFHVKPEHVRHAYSDASNRAVTQGNVGGGTGMICHGFKGGIGSASRKVPAASGDGGYTVGVLVQANHGLRRRLTVDGVRVGAILDETRVPRPSAPELHPAAEGGGSVVIVVATDAPLLPHQCRRLAQRATLGLARTGGAGETFSGDFCLAFSTGNQQRIPRYGVAEADLRHLTAITEAQMDGLFHAVIEATEESVLNALVAARTMTGRDGNTAYALPHDELVNIVSAHAPSRSDSAR